jgi:hypothetical protein
MRTLFLIAAFALSACATPAPAKEVRSDARDCAVLTAVLKQHYKIEQGTRFRIDRNDGPAAKGEKVFRVTCDFKKAGVPIEDYDHKRPSAPPPNFQSWIRFPAKPVYADAAHATVDAGYLLGPLAGAGVRCSLTRDGVDWTIGECKNTWIS